MSELAEAVSGRRYKIVLGADATVFWVRSPSLKLLGELEELTGIKFTEESPESASIGIQEMGQIMQALICREPQYAEDYIEADSVLDLIELADMKALGDSLEEIFGAGDDEETPAAEPMLVQPAEVIPVEDDETFREE